MSQIDLIDNRWSDLMFENRNKEYGAYVLRRQTTARNIKSIITVLILFALVMVYMVAKNAYDDYQAKHQAQTQVDEVRPEDEMKSQDEIMNSKVAVGFANVIGNDESGEVLKAKEALVTEPVKPKEEENKVFDVVEQMPSFPGGMAALMAYLQKSIKYPPVAEENGIQGRVVCTFVVERDGSVTDVRVAKSVDPSLDKEAVRVVSAMPKWIPGKQNGQSVRVKYTLPVTFRLQ